MSAQWELIDVPEPEPEAESTLYTVPDAGHAPDISVDTVPDAGHAPDVSVATQATQTTSVLPAVGTRLGSLCEHCLEHCERCYVIWVPKALAGIHCGREPWKHIAAEIGGYSYGKGHRLRKASSILAAWELYSSEAAEHDVPPEPVCFHHQ